MPTPSSTTPTPTIPLPNHPSESLFDDDPSLAGYHDVLSFSPALDEAVNAGCPRDPLDSSDFNTTEHINLIFPNEQALASVDRVLLKLRYEIRKLDAQIRDIVRSQTDAGNHAAAEMEEAKAAIQALFDKIKQIKDRANESEQMVQEITRDIKALDQSKKNLTLSVTVLKRLQMLVSAIDQLKVMSSRKQYAETAQLLQVVNQLLTHFKSYRNVKQIAQLLDNAAALQGEMKRQIFLEFEGAFVSNTIRNQTVVLNDACLVVDVLGGDVKKQLVEWYCDQQLKDYRAIFRNNPEVAGLDNVSRRFAWLKRLLKTFDEEHAAAFPATWRVAEVLSDRKGDQVGGISNQSIISFQFADY
ncbi:Vacuolar protein sorting-associated protein 53 [Quaeritorhiza haematococci]|nr:Vacuolar protein sorting-associated protein 53 [Quaeritorhiza haematococci]